VSSKLLKEIDQWGEFWGLTHIPLDQLKALVIAEQERIESEFNKLALNAERGMNAAEDSVIRMSWEMELEAFKKARSVLGGVAASQWVKSIKGEQEGENKQ
jgi:hypothetical protein